MKEKVEAKTIYQNIIQKWSKEDAIAEESNNKNKYEISISQKSMEKHITYII